MVVSRVNRTLGGVEDPLWLGQQEDIPGDGFGHLKPPSKTILLNR